LIALADKISKSFGGRILYSAATLQLNAGERWGLVGPNGAGKTTLLRIIMGQEGADEGTVSFAKDITLGYLEQETLISGTKSALSEVVDSAVEIRSRWGEAPILLLSQYVVAAYVQELLADGGTHLGYLLKDRVADIDTFLEAADRVAGGGLVLDPEVVAQVLGRGRKADPVAQLSPREREVLGLMAEGHTNAGIAKRLVVTEGAIEKHTQRIFSKLGLHPDPGVHRRVKAVLTLLSS